MTLDIKEFHVQYRPPRQIYKQRYSLYLFFLIDVLIIIFHDLPSMILSPRKFFISRIQQNSMLISNTHCHRMFNLYLSTAPKSVIKYILHRNLINLTFRKIHLKTLHQSTEQSTKSPAQNSPLNVLIKVSRCNLPINLTKRTVFGERVRIEHGLSGSF